MMRALVDIERELRLALAARQRLCAEHDAIMDALTAMEPTGATPKGGSIRAGLPPSATKKLDKISRALARTEQTIAGLRQQAAHRLHAKEYRHVP
jgi:hypothetical protein